MDGFPGRAPATPRAPARAPLRGLELAGSLGVTVQPRTKQPEPQRERDEPLLGAVVEVALESPARRVAGIDDARTRGAKLLELRAQLGVEPFVLERERGGRTHRPDQLALVLERDVVHDRRHPLAARVDRRAQPSRAVPRDLHGLARGVDVQAPLRKPVGEGERRIREGVGQRVAQAHPPLLGVPEPRDELADGSRPGDAAAEEAGEESERNRCEQHHTGVLQRVHDAAVEVREHRRIPGPQQRHHEAAAEQHRREGAAL